MRARRQTSSGVVGIQFDTTSVTLIDYRTIVLSIRTVGVVAQGPVVGD